MSEVEHEEGVDETPARPEWLPSNFEKPEDLARSYKESQAKLTQQAQEIAAIKAQQEEILAAQQATAYQAQSSTLEEQLAEAMESGDGRQQLAAVAYLVNEATKNYQQPAQAPVPGNQGEILAFNADQALAQKYDDWNEVKADIGKLVEEDPDLLQVNADTPLKTVVSRLERVYKIAKANRVLSQGEQIEQVEQEAHRQAKQAAQTITGASQRPATTDPDNDYWNSVKDTPIGSVRVGRI